MINYVLDLEIIPNKGVTSQEISDLIKRYDICMEAKRQLLSFKISWHDYLDLIECAGVNVDEYLTTANENSLVLGF